MTTPQGSRDARTQLAVVDRTAEQAQPRTLLDIFRETAARNPDSAAIEDPAGTIVYSELLTEVETAARRLIAAGVRSGDRVGVRLPSGLTRVVRGDPERARCRRSVRSGRCRRPAGAGRPGVRRGRRHRGDDPGRLPSHGQQPVQVRRRTAGADTCRRRLDHLHLRLDRAAQGCRRQPPLGGSLRRRGGTALPHRCPPRPRRPGTCRPFRRVRRLVRGDVAGLALRRLSRAGAPFRRAQRRGPRRLARSSPDHRRLDGADPRSAVAGRGPGAGAAADLRRRGLPAGTRRPAGGRGPRGLEHLRPDGGHRRGHGLPARRALARQHRAAAGRLVDRRRRR